MTAVGFDAHHPAWSRDGKKIVFNPATALPVVVKVTVTPSFQITGPVQVPAKGNEAGPASIRNDGIMADGRLIGVVNAASPPGSSRSAANQRRAERARRAEADGANTLRRNDFGRCGSMGFSSRKRMNDFVVRRWFEELKQRAPVK